MQFSLPLAPSFSSSPISAVQLRRILPSLFLFDGSATSTNVADDEDGDEDAEEDAEEDADEDENEA